MEIQKNKSIQHLSSLSNYIFGLRKAWNSALQYILYRLYITTVPWAGGLGEIVSPSWSHPSHLLTSKWKAIKIFKNLIGGAKGLQNGSQNDCKLGPGTALFLIVRPLDFMRSSYGFAWFSGFQGSNTSQKIIKKSHLQISCPQNHWIESHGQKKH